MNLKDCFAFLVDQIHSVVVATVDDAGLPEARVIDLLGYDDAGLYFSTAAGKNFYRQLCARPHVAISGMAGASTMERVAVSVRGEVRELGPERTGELLAANPYMLELYPTEVARATIRLFCVHSGSLDWYDLRARPLERRSFTFGEVQVDVEARRRELGRALVGMLEAEAGGAPTACASDNGGLAVEKPRGPEATDPVAEKPGNPEAADPARLDARIVALLAARGDEPLSADVHEVLELYRQAGGAVVSPM